MLHNLTRTPVPDSRTYKPRCLCTLNHNDIFSENPPERTYFSTHYMSWRWFTSGCCDVTPPQFRFGEVGIRARAVIVVISLLLFA